MRAYKCDRCGALYEKEQEKTGRVYITQSPNIAGFCLDLCPECDKDLQTWFNACADERRKNRE